MADAGAHAMLEPAEPPDEETLGDEGRSSGVPPQLLSRIAHDIRSPLGLLSGALEEIREDLRGHLDEGHERMLALAERGLARLDRMARMLSTMSQLELGSIKLQRERYDLARLVREVVEAVEREDPRRGLTFEIEVPEGTMVTLDLERMRESLWELIAQSRRQAASAVRIASTEDESGIELRIEDDGRGIDSVQRQRAFDRLHEPADRRGTGFGLSVARDLVRVHGGDVTLGDSSLAPSRPGSMGVAFVVTLRR